MQYTFMFENDALSTAKRSIQTKYGEIT